jgi:hypothetical protein
MMIHATIGANVIKPLASQKMIKIVAPQHDYFNGGGNENAHLDV